MTLPAVSSKGRVLIAQIKSTIILLLCHILLRHIDKAIKVNCFAADLSPWRVGNDMDIVCPPCLKTVDQLQQNYSLASLET